MQKILELRYFNHYIKEAYSPKGLYSEALLAHLRPHWKDSCFMCIVRYGAIEQLIPDLFLHGCTTIRIDRTNDPAVADRPEAERIESIDVEQEFGGLQRSAT